MLRAIDTFFPVRYLVFFICALGSLNGVYALLTAEPAELPAV